VAVSKILRTDAGKIIKLTTYPSGCSFPWAMCNLAHLLIRHGSTNIYRCFALPQLLYRWRHQSGIFWIPPRNPVICQGRHHEDGRAYVHPHILSYYFICDAVSASYCVASQGKTREWQKGVVRKPQ
jgi:hypothetical protein